MLHKKIFTLFLLFVTIITTAQKQQIFLEDICNKIMFRIQKMVEALIQTVFQFEWITYPNKNVGFYGGYTLLYQYNKMTNFIDMTLAFKINLKTSQFN